MGQCQSGVRDLGLCSSDAVRLWGRCKGRAALRGRSCCSGPSGCRLDVLGLTCWPPADGAHGMAGQSLTFEGRQGHNLASTSPAAPLHSTYPCSAAPTADRGGPAGRLNTIKHTLSRLPTCLESEPSLQQPCPSVKPPPPIRTPFSHPVHFSRCTAAASTAATCSAAAAC